MTELRVNQQSAVDTWYMRFLKNLETEYHDELAWNLIMMGRATASISMDVYKPFLERHKTEIIKSMLTAIANKDPDITYSDRELGELLIGAKKLGVDWSELDIIEKSLGTNKSINEGPVDPEEKARLRDEGRKLIIDMMRKKAEDSIRGIFYVMYHMDEWGFNLSDWSEIREMIDSRKHDIIVDILKGIKMHGNDGMESARFTISRMRRIGVDWPELAAIEKSIKHRDIDENSGSEKRDNKIGKMKIPDTEEGQLALVRRDPHSVQWIPNPSERVKMEAVSYNGYAIQGIKNPSEEIKLAAVGRNGAALEYIKDPSDAVKLAAVKSDGSAIYYIKKPTDEMKRAAVESWPLAVGYIRNPSDELQVLAVANAPYTIDHINRPSLNAQLTAMKKSAAMILRIRKIDPGLWNSKKVKVKVLKQMLRWLKGRNQEDAAMMAKHLRANACPWPELEIILKSLKTDKLIREETDSYVDDRIKSFIMNQFKSGYMAVMQAMDQHGIMVKDMPEAAEYLEGCKKSMVRTILRKLLDRDYVENIESILALARAVELDWPELDIIEKSLNSNSINEGRLDAEERRQAREYIEGLPFLADSPGDCMYVFSFGYDHGDLFDRSMKPSFQPHRETWIRFLLEELKFGDDHDEIGNAVDILRNRIGLDWPELAIIERSLNV